MSASGYNHNESRDSDIPKGRDSLPETFGEQGKMPIRQALKISENELHLAHEGEKEGQNIEDLQKRLAYLKTKRMEFEKRKYVCPDHLKALSTPLLAGLEHRQRGVTRAQETREHVRHPGLHQPQSILEQRTINPPSLPLHSLSRAKAALIAPVATEKKQQRRHLPSRDKENKENILSRYNNYFQVDEAAGNLAKEPFSKTQLSLKDDSNSRPSSKTYLTPLPTCSYLV